MKQRRRRLEREGKWLGHLICDLARWQLTDQLRLVLGLEPYTHLQKKLQNKENKQRKQSKAPIKVGRLEPSKLIKYHKFEVDSLC